MYFMHAFFISNLERYVFHFMNIRSSSARGRNYKLVLSMVRRPGNEAKVKEGLVKFVLLSNVAGCQVAVWRRGTFLKSRVSLMRKASC